MDAISTALTDEDLARLAEALACLGEARGTIPWQALPALAGLNAANAFTIDLVASARLGAPLVIARPLSPASDHAALSPRERDVAALLAEGLSNKTIARRLGIGLGTVKDHVHRILKKHRAPSRAAWIASQRAPVVPGPSEAC